MTGPRADLVELLRAGLPPRFKVVGSPEVPGRIDRGTFAVRAWASDIVPGPQPASLVYTLVVWVCTPKEDPGTADGDLDDALDAVLAVLLPSQRFLWTRAERGVWNDAYHGWRFDLTAAAKIDKET